MKDEAINSNLSNRLKKLNNELSIALKPKLNFRLEKAKKLRGLISQQIAQIAYSVKK